MEEQQVEAITIVTSDYHQRRCQMLFAATAAQYRRDKAYDLEVVGNYCYAAGSSQELDYDKTIRQLSGFFDLPYEQRRQFFSLIAGL